MYNVLIVDDEKMIREDVKSLLSMEDDLELDLSAVASAVEAQHIFETRKVDLAILDIDMPQMTGMELFDIIRERWPHCKVVFLTGYSDFEYVYKVHQHAKYVLKGDEDAKLLEAVRESLAELERSMLLEELTDLQRSERKDPMVHERSLFLRDLFSGSRSLSQLTEELAVWLKLDMDVHAPVYYVLLRHDAWDCSHYDEQQNRAQDLYELIRRYYFDLMKGSFFEYSKNYLIMFLQPRKLIRSESVVNMLSGSTELFQEALRKNMKRNVSALIGASPLPFGTFLRDYSGYMDLMVWMADGEIKVHEAGARLPGDSSEVGGLPGSENENPPGSDRDPELSGRVAALLLQLEGSIDGMDEENTLRTIDMIRSEVMSVRSMHDLMAVEAYCKAGVKLLGCIKHLGIYEELAFRVGIKDLYNLSQHENWRDAWTYLYRVAESIFTLKNQGMERRSRDVVEQVKAYISDHLDSDTSLYAISEQVHYSQEYLLRTFKKKEGVTVLQYINELKLSRARDMLLETDLTAREIGTRLGFASQGYFGRFFRSKTGMTPNAFRERNGR